MRYWLTSWRKRMRTSGAQQTRRVTQGLVLPPIECPINSWRVRKRNPNGPCNLLLLIMSAREDREIMKYIKMEQMEEEMIHFVSAVT